MATEIQEDYAEIIYGAGYNRCTKMERERIDIMIQRKILEDSNIIQAI